MNMGRPTNDHYLIKVKLQKGNKNTLHNELTVLNDKDNDNDNRNYTRVFTHHLNKQVNGLERK